MLGRLLLRFVLLGRLLAGLLVGLVEVGPGALQCERFHRQEQTALFLHREDIVLLVRDVAFHLDLPLDDGRVN